MISDDSLSYLVIHVTYLMLTNPIFMIAHYLFDAKVCTHSHSGHFFIECFDSRMCIFIRYPLIYLSFVVLASFY